MPIQYVRFSGRLHAPIGSADTTARIADTTGLPALAPGAHFVFTLAGGRSDSPVEDVLIDSVLPDGTIGIERAYGGTVARSWPEGTAIFQSTGPAAMEELVAEYGGSSATWARPAANWEDQISIDLPEAADRFLAEDDSEPGHVKKRVTFGRFGEWITSMLPSWAQPNPSTRIPPDRLGDTSNANHGDVPKLSADKRSWEIAAVSESGATAASVSVDTSDFGGILSNRDNSVQKALETLDDEPAPFRDSDPAKSAPVAADQVAIFDSADSDKKKLATVGDIADATVKPSAQTGGAGTPPHEVALLDRAPDDGAETKNVVAQRMTPVTGAGAWDAAEGAWHFSVTVAGQELELEYPVVGAVGTAVQRGRFLLTGPDDIRTALIPWREAISKITIGIDAHRLFMQDVEVDPTISDGAGLRSSSVNPSNPTGLDAPAQVDETRKLTFDIEFADGSSLYDRQWQTRLTEGGVPFTSTDQAKLDRLGAPGEVLATVEITPVAVADDVEADRRFGQRARGAFADDTGSAQHRPMGVVASSDGLTLFMLGDAARYAGFQVDIGPRTLHIDSAWQSSEDDPNAVEFNFGGDFSDWLAAGTQTEIEVIRPLDRSAYLPGGGTPGDRVTPTADGGREWVPSDHSSEHLVKLLTNRTIGVTIVDPAQDRAAVPTWINVSVFDLTGKNGQFRLSATLRITASTIPNFGFTADADGGEATIRVTLRFLARELRNTPAFETGGRQGIKTVVSVYSGDTKVGETPIIVTRNPDGQRVGVLMPFDTESSAAAGAATVQADTYLSFDENGIGETLDRSDYETTATPSRAATRIAQNGTVGVLLSGLAGQHEEQSITIQNNRFVAGKAGVYHFTFGLHISISTATAVSADEARNFVDLRPYRSTGSSGAKVYIKAARASDYIRRPANANAVADRGPADQSVTVSFPAKLARGDAVGLDIYGRNIESSFATPPVNASVTVSASESEARIVSTEYTLS